MGSTGAWRAHSAKDSMGGLQLRTGGATSLPGTEHTQLPSEQRAQPGPVSCSITRPAALDTP